MLETPSNTLVYVSNTIWDVSDTFQAKVSQKRSWSIFTKISDPGYAKKFKKSSKIEKFFIARNNFKYLSLRQQHHLRCFWQVSGQDLSRKNLVNFHKNLWPRLCKKIQKIMKIEKILFSLKQLKIPQFTSATPFEMFWTSFRSRSLKKELGQFSQKSLTPDMQKNSKNHENRKNSFFLETT